MYDILYSYILWYNLIFVYPITLNVHSKILRLYCFIGGDVMCVEVGGWRNNDNTNVWL